MDNLLFSNQSRFRPGKFCINQLLLVNYDTMSAFDMALEVRVILFDISKFYGKVWQDGLIFMLFQNDTCVEVINILLEFHRNRKQRVNSNDQWLFWADN